MPFPSSDNLYLLEPRFSIALCYRSAAFPNSLDRPGSYAGSGSSSPESWIKRRKSGRFRHSVTTSWQSLSPAFARRSSSGRLLTSQAPAPSSACSTR